MSESSSTPEHPSAGLPVIQLSQLLRAPVVARSGDVVGRVEEINDRGSFRQVQTPQTFVGEGLAPPDGRTPTVLFPLGLGTPAALTLLGLTVFGIIRTVIRRRRRRRIREASASADATG